jgi:hypothetical protein
MALRGSPWKEMHRRRLEGGDDRDARLEAHLIGRHTGHQHDERKAAIDNDPRLRPSWPHFLHYA